MCCPQTAYGRRLDRLYVIICIIAVQLQLQFIIHFLSHQVSIFTHMHSVHVSALSVHYPQCKTLQHSSVVCYITDITLSRMTFGRQPYCSQDSALAPERKGRKGSNIVGLYTHYDLLQTKGQMCAKFGSDRFINVNLYKFHTNIAFCSLVT